MLSTFSPLWGEDKPWRHAEGVVEFFTYVGPKIRYSGGGIFGLSGFKEGT
jgi:hypothetical protein